MNKRPEANEAAAYYSLYTDRIQSNNIIEVLETQKEEMLSLLDAVSEERSLFRYEPGKWSMRELVNHVSDTERVFVFRAFWFARGFTDEMPSFDQNVAAANANANQITWQDHKNDFRAVREATLTFFRSLPEADWSRSGIANGNAVTV